MELNELYKKGVKVLLNLNLICCPRMKLKGSCVLIK